MMKYEYKLSICMMVKDEENNLRRCLEKLKPIVDTGLAELIIVDTGSEDGTVAIAEEFTNKVYFHKWNKNFSEMRNISISYAKGEWIFIIDADERLDDTEKIITLLKSRELNKCNTVLLQVKNLYDYKDEDKYNLILSPRIFRNDNEFKYTGAVHNQPIFKGPNLSVDIALTHFGYISTDKELMEKKYNRTVELLKGELEKEPDNLYYIYQLGVSYDMHKNYKEALEEFRKAYNILKNKNLIKEKTYNYILGSHARIAYTNGELRETIEVAKEVISVEREYVDMYYLLAIAEKQLGNKEESYKFFCTYLDLVKKYNKLEIAKDMTIIMYHMDKDSISIGYFEVYQYYINKKRYSDAYESYKHITNVKHKIYSGINILIELKKYKELKKLYDSLSDIHEKEMFLATSERKINELEDNDKFDIYREFSFDKNIYGLFNQLRLANNEEDKLNLAKLLLESIDFNKEPLFYAEIFLNFKEDPELIITEMIKVEILTSRNIFKYLIEKDESFIKGFEDYILEINGEAVDIDKRRVIISLIAVLLLINISENKEVNNKYSEIFRRYIEHGINFVSELYQIDKVALIYKNVSSVEDRFFLIMFLVNKSLLENNKKSAVSYMMEALNVYEAMAKYIDIYKNDLFVTEEDKQKEVQKQQFQDYKIQVKNTIKSLIESDKFDEALLIINEYQQIVPDDMEIVLLKSQIAIKNKN